MLIIIFVDGDLFLCVFYSLSYNKIDPPMIFCKRFCICFTKTENKIAPQSKRNNILKKYNLNIGQFYSFKQIVNNYMDCNEDELSSYLDYCGTQGLQLNNDDKQTVIVSTILFLKKKNFLDNQE